MPIHHDFEMPAIEFHHRKAFPHRDSDCGHWQGDYASQSPLNSFYIAKEGGGACGTEQYLALPGHGADQFYAEVTPIWERPRKTFDLRNTRVTVYLKALTPIAVNAGYEPYVFLVDYDEDDANLCGWYHNQTLTVGDDWTLNTIYLTNDESLYTRYHLERPIDTVLSRVGFLGVMYLNDKEFTGVNACGVLGIDELTFGLPIK